MESSGSLCKARKTRRAKPKGEGGDANLTSEDIGKGKIKGIAGIPMEGAEW
jgi:hypothetical protein